MLTLLMSLFSITSPERLSSLHFFVYFDTRKVLPYCKDFKRAPGSVYAKITSLPHTPASDTVCPLFALLYAALAMVTSRPSNFEGKPMFVSKSGCVYLV